MSPRDMYFSYKKGAIRHNNDCFGANSVTGAAGKAFSESWQKNRQQRQEKEDKSEPPPLVEAAEFQRPWRVSLLHLLHQPKASHNGDAFRQALLNWPLFSRPGSAIMTSTAEAIIASVL